MPLHSPGTALEASKWDHLKLAKALMYTCWRMHENSPTGLAPAVARFDNADSPTVDPNVRVCPCMCVCVCACQCLCAHVSVCAVRANACVLACVFVPAFLRVPTAKYCLCASACLEANLCACAACVEVFNHVCCLRIIWASNTAKYCFRCPLSASFYEFAKNLMPCRPCRCSSLRTR